MASRQARRKDVAGSSLKYQASRRKPVAINPPSDIVLDVLKAADPSRAQAATERLAALAAGAPASASEDFAKALDAAGRSPVSAAAGMADARLKLLDKDLAEAQKT